MNQKFEVLKHKLKTPLNIVAANEYKPEIERQNHFVEEIFQAGCSIVPFHNIANFIIIKLATKNVLGLNAFQTKAGVSTTLNQ